MGAEQSTLSEPLSSQTRPQRAATRARTNTSFEPGEAQSGAGLETYASLTAFIVLHAIGEGGFGRVRDAAASLLLFYSCLSRCIVHSRRCFSCARNRAARYLL